MHCPTCRHDNPATTRFCSACGAVLVESAPDGGRRRVLRPWGMRRTAPPTISPDMPDLAEAGIPTRGTRLDPAVRFDFWIVGGLVAAVVAVAWISGTARPGRDALHDAAAQVAAGSATHVSATTPTIVQEARLKAPPLVDVSPGANLRTEVTPRVTACRSILLATATMKAAIISEAGVSIPRGRMNALTKRRRCAFFSSIPETIFARMSDASLKSVATSMNPASVRCRK